MMEQLVERLHSENASLVVSNGSRTESFFGRGVSNLYRLLSDDPQLLAGASVADKVVGKGAAALMILGGVSRVHADVVSRQALNLFRSSEVAVSFATEVENIINRKGDGICPVEALCSDCSTAEECLPRITQFLTELKTKTQN